MKFDFDRIVDRRGTSSVKWDENPDVDYPLWVADMDFEAAPSIIEALQRRIDHGVFGYATPSDSFYESVIAWHRRRHRVEYRRDWMILVPGVVPALSAVLRAMTHPSEGVILLTPVYNCFFSSVRNMGCRTEECALRRQGDTFVIDFDDLERRAAKPDVTVMMLCSPHNPCGRMWTREELQRVGDICLRHHVFLLVDEIHCELAMPGSCFFPYAALGEPYTANCCICTSASKCFNVAGLQCSEVIVPDETLRHRIDRGVNIHEVCDIGPLGLLATEAAYNGGEEWLDELVSYIWQNYRAARTLIEAEAPLLRVCRLEATYLMWVDVSAVGLTSEQFCEQIRHDCGVRFSPGTMYGADGEGYIRVNLATQRSRLLEGLRRLARFVNENAAPPA